jgi:hypothetical protein
VLVAFWNAPATLDNGKVLRLRTLACDLHGGHGSGQQLHGYVLWIGLLR